MIEEFGYIIYSNKIEKNKGGPSGYLYNLKSGLEKAKIKDIKIISSSDKLDTVKKNKNIQSISKKLYKLFLINFKPETYFNKGILLEIENIVRRHKSIYDEIANSKVKFFHFHFVMDIIAFENFKNGKNIPKILTSHSPEAFHVEVINNLTRIIQKYVMIESTRRSLISKYTEYYKEIDKKAFESADYIMFPCEEAMEPYFETWSEFKNIIKNKKVFFVPTGADKMGYNFSREDFRKKYNIPKDSFVVSFVGRHNEVKGYDLLYQVAELVWKKNPKVYFLIAGRESPLKGLNDKRWIEVGWTNMPGNVVNASDIFVLPNRRTYFDLILIEVISLGKPAIVSYTGGNKYVSRQSDGIITFEKENIEELAKIVLELSVMRRDEVEKIGLKNKDLYNKFYTPEQFAKRYRKEVGKLFFDE